MNQFVSLAIAATAGLALGLFFFGALWLTVRQLPTARWPGLLIIVSFVVRMAVVVVGFYVVMGDRWERILACLAGFLLARTLLISWARKGCVADVSAVKEEK